MAKKKNKINQFDQIKLFNLEEEKLAFPTICYFIKDSDKGSGFPTVCRFVRSSFNVTQEQMALKLKISFSGYGHWEYAKREPKGFPAFNLRQLYDEAKDLVFRKLNPTECTYQFDQIKLFNLEEEKLAFPTICYFIKDGDKGSGFPAICRFIRETFGVAQQDMALKLGITLTSYGDWEYANHVPQSWQAFNLHQLYNQAKELASSQEANKKRNSEKNSQDSKQEAA